MNAETQIVNAVAKLYAGIDKCAAEHDPTCDACGKCCDFDSFDHRLFVTTPELIYFTRHLSPDRIRPMPTGRCPFNIDGKCIIHNRRFAACRIFSCKGDNDFQSRLSEQSIEELKSICRRHRISYRYVDLKTALNRLNDGGKSPLEFIGLTSKG